MKFLLRNPVAMNPGQVLTGTIKMHATEEQSFNVVIDSDVTPPNCACQGARWAVSLAASNSYNLKDPIYRYLEGWGTNQNSQGLQTQGGGQGMPVVPSSPLDRSLRHPSLGVTDDDV